MGRQVDMRAAFARSDTLVFAPVAGLARADAGPAPANDPELDGILHGDIAQRFRDRLSYEAVFSLARRMPEFSARRVATRKQVTILVAIAAFAAAACVMWPSTCLQIAVVAMSASFVASTAFRAFLAWFGGRSCEAPPLPTVDTLLPVYTIIVPLYREAGILTRLVNGLLALDYPRDKLDIKLVIEEDDEETRKIAEALAPRGPIEVVCVPASQPRTKPKACNFALRSARGEFLVIYDAEDAPEPDQLRKAIGKFRRASRDTACLQARLAIDNAGDSWLATMFALEYAVWFRALLPGLDRLAVPIPLGGTSNHFRTAVLRAAGGWDPFNVTEDADLGLRLAQLGYRVSMLDSTTYEEAPARFGPWLRQRTRWLKGYMQTCLVHTRHPLRFAGRVGFLGVAAVGVFIGGAVWSALINPLLWIVFAATCLHEQTGAGSLPLDSLARISGLGLLTANAVLAGLAMANWRRARSFAVLPYGISFVAYWVLVSAAAYRGLWQLLSKPFYWEKTPHERTQNDSAHGG